MKKANRAVLIFIMALTFTVMLAGCGASTSDGTDALANEQILQESSSSNPTVGILSLPELWYNGSVYMKRWAPVVIIGSLMIGWVIYDLFKKVKEVQKLAFDILIVRIPIFTILGVYAYSWLYRMLNF